MFWATFLVRYIRKERPWQSFNCDLKVKWRRGERAGADEGNEKHEVNIICMRGESGKINVFFCNILDEYCSTKLFVRKRE